MPPRPGTSSRPLQNITNSRLTVGTARPVVPSPTVFKFAPRFPQFGCAPAFHTMPYRCRRQRSASSLPSTVTVFV